MRLKYTLNDSKFRPFIPDSVSSNYIKQVPETWADTILADCQSQHQKVILCDDYLPLNKHFEKG